MTEQERQQATYTLSYAILQTEVK